MLLQLRDSRCYRSRAFLSEWLLLSAVRPDEFLDEHFARARAIADAGAAFAAVCDIEETPELYLFRSDGVECFSDDVRIREMEWFDVPVRQDGSEARAESRGREA